MYVEVPLSLERNHVKKLMKGGRIQLAHHHVSGNQHSLLLHPENAKKLHKALKNQKGVRIELSPGEIEASLHGGKGIKEFFENIWNGIKTGANWVKQNIIDSDFYQKAIKPSVRNAVYGVVDSLPVGKDVAKRIADYGSETTGAYGVNSNRLAQPRVLCPPGISNDHVLHQLKMKKMVKRKKKSGGSFRTH